MKTKTSLMGNSIKTIPFFGRVWLTSRLSRIYLIAISLLFASTLGVSAQVDAMGRRAVLYAASGTFGIQGILYTLDPASGAVLRMVGPLHDAAGNFYGITGLKYHPASGIFYGATGHQSPTNPNYLVIVDPATESACCRPRRPLLAHRPHCLG